MPSRKRKINKTKESNNSISIIKIHTRDPSKGFEREIIPFERSNGNTSFYTRCYNCQTWGGKNKCTCFFIMKIKRIHSKKEKKQVVHKMPKYDGFLKKANSRQLKCPYVRTHKIHDKNTCIFHHVLCRYYLNGNCTFGFRCKNIHPVCIEYYKSGQCTFGNNCYYDHLR